MTQLLPHATRRRNRSPKLPNDPTVWTSVLCLAIALALLWILNQVPAARGDVPEDKIHLVHLAGPVPPVAPGNRLIVSPLYLASLNPQTKFADWVMYRVTPGLMETDNVLSRNWRTGLRDEALEDSDYTHSIYDRGHLIPLDSVSASPYAADVNRLEVIAPQRPDLNRGPWLQLEEHVRALARRHGQVQVTAGCLYESPQESLPGSDEEHAVPSHFWMRLSYGRGKDVTTECYLLPQDAGRDAPLKSFAAKAGDLPPNRSEP